MHDHNRRTPCAIVLGDNDYIADASLIRRHYDAPWSEWQSLVRAQLARAHAGPERWVSLYARGRGMTEADLLLLLVRQANDFPSARILLHHFDSHAAAPALQAFKGRALLSYVSGEAWMLPPLRALLEIQRPQLVVQPVDDSGIPPSAEQRLAIVEKLWCELAPFGLARHDLFVDALSPALGTVPFAPCVSVQTVALAHQSGFSTIAWPGNVALGQQQRDAVAAAFAAQLVHAGLDLAVVASTDTAVLDAVAAANALGLAPRRPHAAAAQAMARAAATAADAMAA